MTSFIPASLIVIFLALNVRALICGKWVAFLPSCVWFTIMVVPQVLDFLFSQNMYQGVQTEGTFLIFAFFIFGDFLGFKYTISPIPNQVSRINLPHLTKFAIGFLLLIPTIHYFIAGEIPVLNLISGEDAAQNRESFSKVLNLPYLIKVIPNLFINIFAPLTLYFLFTSRAKKSFVIMFLWVFFYAISSTAEYVAVIFLALLGLVLVLTKKPNANRLIGTVASCFLALIIVSGFSMHYQLSSGSNKCGAQIASYDSFADKYRVCRELGIEVVNPLVDKLGYRVFFTPIEVSGWWYKYYQQNPHREFSNLFSRDLNTQPSNIIGKIAYFDRFPRSYLSSISAYSSVDADAFSFGWYFVWIAGLILLTMRVVCIIGFRSNNETIRALGAILFGSLILFPFASSIQAILIAQGAVIPLAVIGIFHLKSHFVLKRESKFRLFS
jgi:hypothetical protein